MTELTLHIGMNKTGTTALQTFLFQNRQTLSQAGLLYPKTGLGNRLAGRGLHYRLSAAFLNGDASAPDMMSKLLEEMDASEAKHAIVSSEFFVDLRDLGPLARSLAGRQVRILVYLRRHDHWVSSLFSQAVKSRAEPPWGPSAEAFIRHIRHNVGHYYVYSRLLDRWAAAFGREAVHARLYDRDVITDALAQFGLSPASLPNLKWPDGRENRSPSRRQLAAIDHVQRAPYPDAVRVAMVRRILDMDDAAAARDLITAQTAHALIEEHKDDYAKIAKTYLGRSDGVLFDEPLPDLGGPDKIALWPREGITVLTQLLADAV